MNLFYSSKHDQMTLLYIPNNLVHLLHVFLSHFKGDYEDANF
jgi:hypothetical protein